MTLAEIRTFSDDARRLGDLVIHARDNDPDLTQAEREELDALLHLCAGCLRLARTLSAKPKKGA